jgi:ferric-dicitrate binding protein FerR (iron transport regulator)
VGVFTFISIAVWSEARRKEREALYRSEALKKVAESSAAGGTAALDMMREYERADGRRRRESHKLGGLITIAVGFGLVVFMAPLGSKQPIFLVGAIPLFVGVVLVAYAYLFARWE